MTILDVKKQGEVVAVSEAGYDVSYVDDAGATQVEQGIPALKLAAFDGTTAEPASSDITPKTAPEAQSGSDAVEGGAAQEKDGEGEESSEKGQEGGE